MNQALIPPAADPAANVLAPGASWFMVMVAPKILAANGAANYEMHGPFASMGQAAAYSAERPGSLITVTLVLHQAQALSPQLQAAMAAKVAG